MKSHVTKQSENLKGYAKLLTYPQKLFKINIFWIIPQNE